MIIHHHRAGCPRAHAPLTGGALTKRWSLIDARCDRRSRRRGGGACGWRQRAARRKRRRAGVVYSDTTPAYRFYPGDEIEITVFSAPELTRTVTVGPDGRIALPLIGAVRAADLTADELHDGLVAAYAPHLRMPELTRDAAHLRFAPSVRRRRSCAAGHLRNAGQHRRFPSRRARRRLLAERAARRCAGALARQRRNARDAKSISRRAPCAQGFPSAQPLQRYDVVYVPRSTISQVNLFMQQYVRDALPVQFSFYYDLARRPEQLASRACDRALSHVN